MNGIFPARRVRVLLCACIGFAAREERDGIFSSGILCGCDGRAVPRTRRTVEVIAIASFARAPQLIGSCRDWRGSQNT